MGVELIAHVEVEYRSDFSDGTFWSEVCEACGRLYHWESAFHRLYPNRFPEYSTWKYVHARRNEPIFDGAVRDTPLYCILRALAKRHGKKHVRVWWEVSA